MDCVAYLIISLCVIACAMVSVTIWLESNGRSRNSLCSWSLPFVVPVLSQFAWTSSPTPHGWSRRVCWCKRWLGDIANIHSHQTIQIVFVCMQICCFVRIDAFHVWTRVSRSFTFRSNELYFVLSHTHSPHQSEKLHMSMKKIRNTQKILCARALCETNALSYTSSYNQNWSNVNAMRHSFCSLA